MSGPGVRRGSSPTREPPWLEPPGRGTRWPRNNRRCRSASPPSGPGCHLRRGQPHALGVVDCPSALVGAGPGQELAPGWPLCTSRTGTVAPPVLATGSPSPAGVGRPQTGHQGRGGLAVTAEVGPLPVGGDVGATGGGCLWVPELCHFSPGFPWLGPAQEAQGDGTPGAGKDCPTAGLGVGFSGLAATLQLRNEGCQGAPPPALPAARSGAASDAVSGVMAWVCEALRWWGRPGWVGRGGSCRRPGLGSM